MLDLRQEGHLPDALVHLHHNAVQQDSGGFELVYERLECRGLEHGSSRVVLVDVDFGLRVGEARGVGIEGV